MEATSRVANRRNGYVSRTNLISSTIRMYAT